jgi:hypothetical protein
MGKFLFSLAFATALLAVASSEASANFVCQAVGARSVGYPSPVRCRSLPITVNPADKGALRLRTSDATVAFTGPGPSSPLAGIGGMSPSPADSSKRGDYP